MTRLRRKPWTFDYLKSQDHVVLNPDNHRGKWHEYFGNDHPIHVELGMGKGKFISELSVKHPDTNFIGIDMYDELLRFSSQKAVEMHYGPEEAKIGQGASEDGKPYRTGRPIANLALVLGNIEKIEEIFAPGEIDRIYLNFSDPWPKKRHENRRLTHPEFLRKYRTIIRPGGELHQKTDSSLLFEFSLNSFADAGLKMSDISLNIHREGTPEGHIFTEYEEKFVSEGLPIYGCKVQF